METLPRTELEADVEAAAEPDADAVAAVEALGDEVAAREMLLETVGLRLVLAPKLTVMDGEGKVEGDTEVLTDELAAALPERERVAASEAETDALAVDEALRLRLSDCDDETLALAPTLRVGVGLALREPLELRDVDRLAEADADTEAVETVVADQDTLELCVNEAL